MTPVAFQPQRIVVDRDGRTLWMLSWEATGDFLVKFDPQSGSVERYRLTGGPRTSGYYLGLAQTPDGDLWIGWGAVLVRFDPKTGTQSVVKLPAPQHVVPPGTAKTSIGTTSCSLWSPTGRDGSG